MLEIVTRSNTSQPLHLSMVAVDHLPPESVFTKDRSILFISGQLGKEIESIESQALDTSTPTGAFSSNENRLNLDQGGTWFITKSHETDDSRFGESTTALENGDTAPNSSSKDKEISENQFLQQQKQQQQHHQQWLHQNMKYMIEKLLQERQDFQNQTYDRHRGQSNDNGENGPPSNQASKDSSKRKQNHETYDLEATSGPSKIAKRRRRTVEDHTEPPLACPFSKKDLRVYRECTRFGFKRVRDVKQHLKRNHSLHVEEAKRVRLQRPSSRGTREQQWYEVFHILFPGHLSRPCSPYNNFEICEQPLAVAAALDEALNIPYHYLMTDGAGILLQEIQQDPTFAREGGPGINDMRRALGRLFGQYLNQQLARPLGASNGNNGTPEESLGSNPATIQEGLGSGSERTDTLVPESPNHTLGNQTEMLHLSDHRNSFIGTDQATRNFTQYDTGILVSVNQALEVAGEDMDTVAATNHEEPPPREFEELWGTYTDFVFEDNPSYS